MIRLRRCFNTFSVCRSAAVFAVAALFSCTAYFNTFYNAEMAFEEGQKSHQKLLRNYPDSIIVTPPMDAVGKYDRAIDKASKLIETFPKAVKWHDDALFLMGRSHFYKKEMVKAIRRLRQLEQEFPASPLLPETYMYLGKAYIEDGNLDKAEEILMRAEDRWPQLNSDRRITLLLIAIAIKRNGKSQAIGLLEETVRSVRSVNLRTDLIMRTAELYIDLKQYRKAIVLLKTAPRRKDFPFLSYRMDRALLVCHTELDSLQAAYNLVGVMIEQKLYGEYMDEMLFQKGRILTAMGKTDEAIKVFRKLTAGLDSSTVAGDTSQFKARALQELALIYQKNKEDYKKAHSYLKLASTARDTTVSRSARQKLTAIDELYRLRGESSKKDSATFRRLFSIGELFRFELDEPDSAYDQFIKISRDSLADTSLIPRAILQAAIIARDQLYDTLRSDSLFKRIIDTYPASEYAKTGQRQLALALTVKTRADSAAEAYLEAEKLFYQQNDVKGAIRAFFDISKKYDELPIAPKSLFAAAWFSDNVLLKKKTARSLYDKICTKYPKSDYCVLQAKPRMKIVADTLEKLERLRKENEKKQPGKKSTPKVGQAATVSTADSTSITTGEEQELFGNDDTTNTTSDTSSNRQSGNAGAPVSAAAPQPEPGAGQDSASGAAPLLPSPPNP